MRDTNKSNQTAINTLIFDLTGVLFIVDQRKVFKLMGLSNVLLYTLTHFKNPYKQALSLTEIMAQKEPAQSTPLYYKGYLQPQCITSLLLGTMTAEQAYKELEGHVDTLAQEGHIKSKRELQLIRDFVTLLTDEKTKVSIWTPNYVVIGMIKQMQENGIDYYILSNLDLSSYEYLSKRYQDIFSLFTDAVISAQVGMIKPDQLMYTYLIEKHALKPASCLFIDDQQENINAAQDLGINGILYTSNRSLKRHLKGWHLLN